MLQLILNVALENSVLFFVHDIFYLAYTILHTDITWTLIFLTNVLSNIWETYQFLSFLI